MAQHIARTDESRALEQPVVPPYRRLDPYAPGGIAAQAGRLAPLAIVSLGFRQAPRRDGELGLPRATRRDDERWLHLHDPDGRAPGLEAALEAGSYRRLQIAFPMDHGFIQQSFTRWSASALEIYGDANGLYVIDTRDAKNPQHRFIPPEHPEFGRLLKTCKAETRIYFALAHWLPELGPDGEPQSEVLFPDGFGFYVFRTAGRHTAAEIMGYLESISGFTHGRIAGIPFDLDVVFREVVGPDGKKRLVPIANVVVRPPEHIKLNSRTFRQLATAGLEEGRNLQLPALPSAEELALQGPPDLEEEIPQEAMQRLAAGDFPCDYNLTVRTWHAIVRGTPLESDEARAEWLRGWSKGEFDSLTAARGLSQREATQMLADLADGVSDVREELAQKERAELAAKYDRIYGSDAGGSQFADMPGNGPRMAQSAPAEPNAPQAIQEPEAALSELAASYRTLLADAQQKLGDALNTTHWELPADASDEEIEEKGVALSEMLTQAQQSPQLRDEGLKRNTALLADAEAAGVKGLRMLRANRAEPIESIIRKNAELSQRVTDRANEADFADAQQAEQPEF